jgi:hypothetical protein
MPGVQTIAKQVVETVGSVAGIRIGLEEPKFNAVELARGVQIRHYGERIAAQTKVSGESEDQARSTGFRRVAAYIFGGNDGGRSIAMTAPVAVQTGRSRGTKIAMTAPVAQQGEDDEWVIRFFMPAEWTMDTLPKPNDPRVELVTVPPQKYAVLRFSGGYDARRVADRRPDCGRSCGRTVSRPPANPRRGSSTHRGRCPSAAVTRWPFPYCECPRQPRLCRFRADT